MNTVNKAKTTAMQDGNKRLQRSRLSAAVSAASLLLAGAIAVAGPQGGVVTGGNGAIAQSGSTTNVEQLTDRMSVQWQSFDLGRTETVNFLQPDSSSIVLNQILQNGPSQINGLINANGHVLLVNPRGVIFGETSVINVGALTASTLWLERDDFLNGDLVLRALDGEQGVVVNGGLINAATGGVTLLGEAVHNAGLITAELGYVNLASGREAYLTFDEEGFLGVRITGEVAENLLGTDSSVENSGAISASGGKVILEAAVSRGLFDSAVNNSGIIEATGFDGGHGGTVRLLGDTVAVTKDARIHVDGASGGGEILVGGDYQGANLDIANARFTNVEAGALLTASATQSGDGGKVVIWADDTTRFHGHIEARGGNAGGDGGLAEVSGKEHLAITGFADLRAPAGAAGSLLLDPGTVTVIPGTIAASSDDEVTDGWINDQITMGDTTIATDASGDNGSGGSSGDEDIVFAAGVVIDIDGNNTLTFFAGEDILFDATTVIAPMGTGGDLELFFGQADAGGTLNFAGASVAADNVTIEGGGGTDTIMGASTYVVDQDFKGTADGFDFEFVENLTGTSGVDSFTVNNNDEIGTLSGLGGNDTFTIDGDDNDFAAIDGGDDTDSLGYSGNTLDLEKVTLSNLETVTAGGNATLEGGTTYAFISNTAVAVAGVSDSFTGFDTIRGTTGNDTFNLAGFAFADALEGLGGADTFNLAGGTVNDIDGGSDTDTITGASAYAVTGNFSGVANGVGGFSAVENLTGTAGVDTFTLTSGSIEDLVGLDGDDVFNVAGTSFDSIDGGSVGEGDADSDVVNFANSTSLDLEVSPLPFVRVETVNGNGGSDTLSGATVYTVTGASTIQANVTGAVSYVGFETVEGTSAADTFNIAGFTFTGALLGLAGNDTFNLAGGSADITGGNNTDTITGASNYQVTDDNEGTANLTAFAGVENLTGTAGVDTFTLTSGSIEDLVGLDGDDVFNVDGTSFDSIDGGSVGEGDADSDVVNFANSTSLDLEVSPLPFVRVETVNGNGGSDTLSGATVYTVTGASTIQANVTGAVNYVGFETVEGTGAVDTFNIAGFTFTGALLGLAGNDIFNLAGGSAGITGGNNIDTITGASNYQVTGPNAGSANSLAFSGVENLTGTNATDTFTLTTGSIGNLVGLDDSDVFTISGATFTSIDGGSIGELDADADSVVFSEPVTLNLTSSGITRVEGVVALGNAILEGASTYSFVSDTSLVAAGDLTTTYFGFDTIRGTSGADTFFLNGFDFAGTLQGLGEADTFDLTGTGTVGSIVGGGGGGFDVVRGATNYVVNAASGGIANSVGTYSGIELIEGTAGIDLFTLTSGFMLFVGGGGGNDVFTAATGTFGLLNGNDGTDTLTFTSDRTLDLSSVIILNMEFINANGANDVLTGASEYTVTGFDSVVATVTGTTAYGGFETIEGTSDPDVFNVAGFGFGGLLKGLAGEDLFNLAGGSASIDGDQDTDTITGGFFFEVSGANAGTANFTGFDEVENLTGTTGTDVFTLTSGSIGDVVGLDGDDFFDILTASFDSIDGGDPAELDADFDVVNYFDTATLDLESDPMLFTRIEIVVGNTLNDTLRGATEYTITGSSTVQTNLTGDVVYSGFEFVEGTTGDDTFNVGGFPYTGTLRGLDGGDTFALAGGSVFRIEGGPGASDSIQGGSHYVVNDMADNVANMVGTFDGVEGLTGTSGDDFFALVSGEIPLLAGLEGDDEFEIDQGTFMVLDGGPDTDTVTYVAPRIVDITADPNPFANVEIINAAPGSTLTGASVYRFTSNTAVVADDNLDTTFNGFDTLIGTLNADLFDLAGFSFAGTLDGVNNGAPNDEVSGARFFEVTGVNMGFAGAANETTLLNIENLTGTTGADVFTLTSGAIGDLQGLGGNDRFNVSDPLFDFDLLDGGAADDAVDFTAQVDLNLNPSRFTSIEAVNATVAGSSLFGASAYTFVSGSAVQADFQPETVYDGFDFVRGTGGDDVFDLAGNNYTGTIDGLGESGGGDTVIGSSAYRVTGLNSAVAGVGGTTALLEIENLVGTQGNDDFNLDGIAFAGTLDGLGAGAAGDVLRGSAVFSVFAPNTGEAGEGGNTQFSDFERLVGTPGDDLFEFVGTGFVDAVVGGDQGDQGDLGDTITGAQMYTVDNPGGGSASTVGLFIGIENLVGTSGADVFAFIGGGTIDTVDGLSGFDTADYSGANAQEIDTTDLVNIERVVGGAAVVLRGMDWVIGAGVDDQVNDGTVDGLEFVDFVAIAGTAGDDSFMIDGGTVGAIDGGGEGEAGDTLSGDTGYTVTGAGAGTASAAAQWSGLENLVGTAGDDTFTLAGGTIRSIDGMDEGSMGDTLAGESVYTVTGEGSGVSPSVTGTWTGIENLVGTAAADTFNLDAGSIANVDGLAGDDIFNANGAEFANLLGGAGSADTANFNVQVALDVLTGPLESIEIVNAFAAGSSLVSGNNYTLISDSAVQVNGDSGIRYDGFTTLTGTEGDDVFDIGGFVFSGTIEGGGHDMGDQLVITQDEQSGIDIGIIVDGDSGAVGFGFSGNAFENAGPVDFQLSFSGIEDFLLSVQQDLNIKGSGLIQSSADILVGGSLRLIGPDNGGMELVLQALQNVDVGLDLEVIGLAILDLSSTDGVVSVGRGVFVDTANGASINGFVAVNITEEPVLQLQVEEATSLSVFGDIDIFSAGRSSVRREDDDEIASESELIDFLSGPGL